MSLELWIAFVAASAVVLTVPGPTVMLVVSYALRRGRATGWATVPGVALGDFTAMTASLLGAGAVLAASATLFAVLKYAGAAYLIWLGIKLWRADPHLADIQETPEDVLRRTVDPALKVELTDSESLLPELVDHLAGHDGSRIPHRRPDQVSGNLATGVPRLHRVLLVALGVRRHGGVRAAEPEPGARSAGVVRVHLHDACQLAHGAKVLAALVVSAG